MTSCCFGSESVSGERDWQDEAETDDKCTGDVFFFFIQHFAVVIETDMLKSLVLEHAVPFLCHPLWKYTAASRRLLGER